MAEQPGRSSTARSCRMSSLNAASHLQHFYSNYREVRDLPPLEVIGA